MSMALYFPKDVLDRKKPDFDVAADYLELLAFFDKDGQALSTALINASEIAAEDDYDDVDEEMKEREEIVSGAILRISKRSAALGSAYPFSIDSNGDVLTFVEDWNYGRVAYILCLILSHLKAVSPILTGTQLHPSKVQVEKLRRFFQYFATAAMAAEVNGRAWSFGYPRRDESNFHDKLREVWRLLKDGVVGSSIGVPTSPKDDQVDIFAARLHRDGLPGFIFAAAQVATGKNWMTKSLRSHINDVFLSRWFTQQPVTKMMCYHIIPFARPDAEFYDHCRVFGSVLHRLRVPSRVQEAVELHGQSVEIEDFDALPEAAKWVKTYRRRALRGA